MTSFKAPKHMSLAVSTIGIHCACGVHVLFQEWATHVVDDTPPTLRSGDRVATGTGADRRRLTLDEASVGALPDRFTEEEWAAMHRAVLHADYDARRRTVEATRASWRGDLP